MKKICRKLNINDVGVEFFPENLKFLKLGKDSFFEVIRSFNYIRLLNYRSS